MMGGFALAFSFQAGVLLAEVGSQSPSAAESTEKLRQMDCPLGVPVIQSDTVFWPGARGSSSSLRRSR